MNKCLLAFAVWVSLGVSAWAGGLSSGGGLSAVGVLTPGSTPTGCTALSLFYANASSKFACMAGTSWDNTNRSLTITGATVTASNPVLNLSQTWNAVGVAFTGLKFNVTDTASASTSLLVDVQIGAASKFAIRKDGFVGVNNSAPTYMFDVGSTAAIANQIQRIRGGGGAGVDTRSIIANVGNGGAGRGVALSLQPSGSANSVEAVRLAGLQETAAATATNASFVVEVANTSAVLTERLRINSAGNILAGAAVQIVPASVTVAALPTGVEGGLINVSDQLTACPAKGGTFTGGGAVTCLAHFEEGAWVAP
jgi:hypothetical protein